MKGIVVPTNFKRLPVNPLGSPNIVSGAQFIRTAEIGSCWHVHECAFIVYVESGRIGIRTYRESVVLSSKMMMYVPSLLPHYEKCVGRKVTGWYLSLPREQVKFMPNTVRIIQVSGLLAELCEKIVSWGEVSETVKTPAQTRLVLTFLDELAEAKAVSYLSIPFPEHAALLSVAKTIMESPGDKNSIDHWARVAGMSRRSFTGRFRSETGVSFAVWRRRVQLQAALKELCAGRTVTEVAADLGYATTSAFIGAFRQQFGMTPKQYVLERNKTRSPRR